MFADDTNLSDKNINCLFTKMNSELNKASTWFKANKLSLNIKKTKYTIFHHKKKHVIPNDLPILQIENVVIKRENVTKFLGVLIDENLTWKAQIAKVSSTISKSIGILYRARPMLKKSHLN